MTINLVFLGRRGAGNEFMLGAANYLLNEQTESNFRFIVASDNDLSHKIENLGCITTEFNPPRGLRDFSTFFKFIPMYIRFLISTRASTTDRTIFLLPSPFDYFLCSFTPIRKTSKIFLIHDFANHPGEHWPKIRSIRWRVRQGKEIVTLSNFVRSEIRKYSDWKPISLIPHPTFDFASLDETLEIDLPAKFILFLGRVRKYKGVEVLIEAHRNSNNLPNLVIAGQGNQLKIYENQTYLNKWLSNSEMLELITKAELLVFPYVEASQSGLIPVAIQLGKKIVVSDVGGLTEQIVGYPHSIRVEPGNAEKLKFAIHAALNMPATIGSTQLTFQRPTNLKDFFSELFQL